MQRSFLKAVVIAFFAAVLTSATFGQEGGYVGKLSITQGDTQQFFISTSFDTIPIRISRLGAQKREVYFFYSYKGGIQLVPDSAYAKGCHWRSVAELRIPTNWKAGVYEADFPVTNGTKRMVFVIKEKELGTRSKVLVGLTVNTYQAYNNWGGKSLYGYNSTDKIASPKVSFDRPFSDDTTVSYFRWSNELVHWLDEKKIAVEYCTNVDLDNDPSFLTHYNVFITVGHDEYWSRPERNACQNFVNSGGRMMILSGNTCWWQVRLEDSSHTLVCYKDYTKDPMYPSRDSIVTCNWRRFPVNDSENVLTGVSFEQGGYVNNGTTLPHTRGYGGYMAYNTQHWIFDNTNLADGESFGLNASIVGYETDGTPFKWTNGIPRVTGRCQTSPEFSILGLSAAKPDGNAPGFATMGYFPLPSGGAVFNTSTTNWVYGLTLYPDSSVSRITMNVLRRFMRGASLPPEIYNFGPVRVTQDSIDHVFFSVAHRNLEIDYGRTDTFFVQARDPVGMPLHYLWFLGDKIISEDSSFYLSPADKQLLKDGNVVRVRVSNGQDTVTLDWGLVGGDLEFGSSPPSNLFWSHSQFSYAPKAYSLTSDSVRYELLDAPAWLHLSTKNIVNGDVGPAGSYSVSIRATDTRGNSDVQSFEVVVQDAAGSASTLSGSMQKSSIYPNPFSSATRVEFDLMQTIPVFIEIVDVQGKHVCWLERGQAMSIGSHAVFWDGCDDKRKSVGTGNYFCRIATIGPNGATQTVVLKLSKI